MTGLRAELSAAEAERASATASVAHLTQLAASMQGDREQKQALIASYDAENKRIVDQITEREQAMADCAARGEAQREALKNELAERASVERAARKRERAQNKSREILNMERESARLDARKNAAEMEEKQIIDKLWESYELTRSTAPEAAAEIENVGAAQKRAAELKRKISALGTPNLGAIDEFARVNERYTYLTEQRDDVLTSKRELEHIVADIVTQMTEILRRNSPRSTPTSARPSRRCSAAARPRSSWRIPRRR